MSLTGFPLDSAELVGTLCETLVYGAALFATARTVSDLSARVASGNHVNLVFRLAPWLLILVATIRISIDWYRNIFAFTKLPTQEERIFFLIDITQWHYAAKDALYGVQAWLGDLIIIYRVYIIWGRRWPFIVIPCTSFLVTLATSLGSIALEAEANLLFIGRLKTFVSIAFISMVITTVSCTVLIVLRIYRTKQKNAVSVGWYTGSIDSIIAIILQSGVTYALIIILVFGFYQAGSNIQIIPYNCICPLIALLFSNMMQGTSLRTRGTTSSQSISHSHSQDYSRRNTLQPAFGLRSVSSQGPGGPFEIGVTQHVEIHRDRDGSQTASRQLLSPYDAAKLSPLSATTTFADLQAGYMKTGYAV